MKKTSLLLFIILLTSTFFAKEYTLSGFKLDLNDVKESSYMSSGILAKAVEIKLNNATLKLKQGMAVEFDLKKSILKKAYLDGDQKLNFDGNNVILKGDTEVLMDLTFSDKTPTLISGHMAGDAKIKIGDYEINAKAMNDKYQRDIVVSAKGYILSAFLVDNFGTKIGNVDFTFAAGSKIEFEKALFGDKKYISSGKVIHPSSVKVGNYELNLDLTTEDENIGFYESSEISRVRLGEDVSLKTKTQAVPFVKSKLLYLSKEGIVKNGYVSQDVTLKAKGNDKLFKKNSSIYFDKTGEVER